MNRDGVLPPTRFRDAAEWREAPTVDPVYPQDSPEDMIREAVKHLHLTDAEVAAILKVRFEDREDETTNHDRLTGRKRAVILRELIKHFDPPHWTLPDWWAIQFAIQTEITEGKSPALVCQVLNMSRAAFGWYVTKWRKKLKLPKTKDLWRESQRLSQRRKKQERTQALADSKCQRA